MALKQLTGLGLAPRAVQKRARSGRLHRIHAGVYAIVPRTLLKREGLWMAAVLACGPDAVLSHRSAAALHGLRPNGGARIDVTVPRRSHRRRAGVKLHRSCTLGPEDTTEVRAICCTTVARTLLDLAEVVDRRTLERACDQAEILQAFDLQTIAGQLHRNAARHGAPRLRAVLREHYIGQTATLSELEERFLALIRDAGLPDPRINSLIELGDGGPPIRADFAWPERRLIVETDGRKTHMTRQAFEHDRDRDQRVAAVNWRSVRITWRQVVYAREEISERLVRLYAAH